MTKIANFENSRRRTVAIMKMFFHYISAAKTDFGKIWYADASLDSECDYVKKLSSLQIQNDAFLKSFFGYRLSERPYYDPVSSVGTLGAMQFRGNGYKTAKKCLN